MPTVTTRVRGFPQRFPVRDDGRRSLRYHSVSTLSRVVLRCWFGAQLRFEGVDNIPAEGPLLVVSNHLSNIDPFLFGAYAPGAMFCMAKSELFRNRVMSWMLAGCNCFPVDRGTADRWALRTSLRILALSGRLVIFLEGTRSASAGMKRAEAGVGFLARRSRARVLPVAIWGTERALPRGRRLPRRVSVTVRYGDAFLPDPAPPGASSDQALADQIGRSIAALLPRGYRGEYA